MTQKQLTDSNNNNIYPLAHSDTITTLTDVATEKLADGSVEPGNIVWADFRTVSTAGDAIALNSSISLPADLYDYDQLKLFYVVQPGDDNASKRGSITIPVSNLQVDTNTWHTISFPILFNSSSIRVYFVNYQIVSTNTGYAMNFVNRYYTWITNSGTTSSGASTDSWTVEKSYLLKLH